MSQNEQTSNQNRDNDIIFLTKQFDSLPKGWEYETELYNQVLGTHVFRCEADCDVEGTASDRVPDYDRHGKKVPMPLFVVFQLKAEVELKDRKTGKPIIDRDTDAVVKRPKVVLRRILCRKHSRIDEEQARGSGFGKEAIRTYGLPANLEFLSNEAQKRVQRDLVKEFFTAMAKGERTVADGMKAEFIFALPTEGEEIKPDSETREMPHVLAYMGKLAGLVTQTNARSYHFARKADTELFNKSGYYLYETSLAQAKALAEEHEAKQAEWKAKMADREADNKRRAEEQKAAAAKSQSIFAGLAKKFLPGAADPKIGKDGDRRGKERDRRDGPKPQRKSTTPKASDQIAEGLDEAKTAREAADAVRAAEPEEPRSSAPTLTAPLVAHALVQSIKDDESTE